jgi:hypothetical protein
VDPLFARNCDAVVSRVYAGATYRSLRNDGAHLLIKNADFRVVRFAAAAFWMAILLVLTIITFSQLGINIETVGTVALPIGLLVDLLGDALT